MRNENKIVSVYVMKKEYWLMELQFFFVTERDTR